MKKVQIVFQVEPLRKENSLSEFFKLILHVSQIKSNFLHII
jgi:hypothetical protein